MEFIMYFFLTLSLYSNHLVEQTPMIESESTTINEEAVPIPVTIVMHDDILLITIGNSGDLIDEIELFDSSNSSVLRAENCNSNVWSIDLSFLSSGDYDVNVLTTLSNSFNDSITLN